MLFLVRARLLVLAALVISGCARTPAPQVTPSAQPTMSLEQEEDLFAQKLLSDKAHCLPATAWLATTRNHLLWKGGDRTALLAHFQEMEKAGVKGIWAYTQDYQDQQIAAAFVLVLPPPGDLRKNAFRLHNRFWDALIQERTKLELVRRRDEGQKFLIYSFD